MCITCVRVILTDAMVVLGLEDVVDTVVVVVVVVGFSSGNIGNVGPSGVVSSGNSIPVMALCFCSIPKRPNFCADAVLCPGLGGESSHLC